MRNALVCAALLLVAAGLYGSGTCSDPYLMIPGVDGGLTGSCQGAIEFASMQMTLSSLTITKSLDKASPKLMQACASGQHFNKATLMIPTDNKSFTFDQVLVSSYSVGGSGDSITEQVSFNFTKIEFRSGGGTTGSAVTTTPPRTFSAMGSARPNTGAFTFASGAGGQGRGITRWQLTMRQGGSANLSIQLAPPPPGMASTPMSAPMRAGAPPMAMMPAPSAAIAPGGSNHIELKLNGGRSARLVFQGSVPAQGGNVQVQGVQINWGD